MGGVSRRQFVGLSAGGIGLAASGLASGGAAAGAGSGGGIVRLEGDGVSLTPDEYAALLGDLVASGKAGADEYSRGGAVAELEATFARLLGKETAVFMPTGTLANQLAVRALAKGRSRVIVQEVSHLYNDCGDCAQTLSALNLVPLAPGQATFTAEDVERVLERTASGRVATEVGAISIESPVRRLRQELFDLGEMKRICARARGKGIGLHLDGARLFVASAYTGVPPAEYAAPFDTVYVSLWKCFNSGSGAILAGPRALLDEMYHARRMFGGALWQAWPFAAVARSYADGFFDRLRRAIGVAGALQAALRGHEAFAVETVPNGTSVFRLRVRRDDLAAFRERLLAHGVQLPEPREGVFSLTVNETLNRQSPESLAAAFRAALG